MEVGLTDIDSYYTSVLYMHHIINYLDLGEIYACQMSCIQLFQLVSNQLINV